MPTVCLVHWKEAELEERVARLEIAGYAVDAWSEVDGAAFLRSLQGRRPAAVVIDLSRLPSHGREVGVALRSRKATRMLPLVFVEGTEEKVARVKTVLPDATFATWRGIKGALKRAIANPPADPTRPTSAMAAYAKTPLPKKLGIRAESTLALIDAPEDFETTLGTLPAGATVRRGARGTTDLTLFFAKDRRALEAKLEKMLPRASGGGLWIVWPKKSSQLASDLTQPTVRKLAMDAGLVDFKICAVDETWSGLRFTRKRQ